MIKFYTKKLLEFQENLSDGLNVSIGMFNSDTGECLTCRCELLKNEPELFEKHCLPFFRNCSNNADPEIQNQTCPLGLNCSYSLIQGQPVVLFVGAQLNPSRTVPLKTYFSYIPRPSTIPTGSGWILYS